MGNPDAAPRKEMENLYSVAADRGSSLEESLVGCRGAQTEVSVGCSSGGGVVLNSVDGRPGKGMELKGLGMGQGCAQGNKATTCDSYDEQGAGKSYQVEACSEQTSLDILQILKRYKQESKSTTVPIPVTAPILLSSSAPLYSHSPMDDSNFISPSNSTSNHGLDSHISTSSSRGRESHDSISIRGLDSYDSSLTRVLNSHDSSSIFSDGTHMVPQQPIKSHNEINQTHEASGRLDRNQRYVEMSRNITTSSNTTNNSIKEEKSDSELRNLVDFKSAYQLSCMFQEATSSRHSLSRTSSSSNHKGFSDRREEGDSEKDYAALDQDSRHSRRERHKHEKGL